jgi:Protein of unknown function (DUF2795)
MTRVSVKDLENALQAADFPATKEQLLEAAAEQDAGQDVRKALRSLPPVDYGSVGEVISSVTVDVGSGVTDDQHAELARNKRDQGVAESLRRREP